MAGLLHQAEEDADGRVWRGHARRERQFHHHQTHHAVDWGIGGGSARNLWPFLYPHSGICRRQPASQAPADRGPPFPPATTVPGGRRGRQGRRIQGRAFRHHSHDERQAGRLRQEHCQRHGLLQAAARASPASRYCTYTVVCPSRLFLEETLLQTQSHDDHSPLFFISGGPPPGGTVSGPPPGMPPSGPPPLSPPPPPAFDGPPPGMGGPGDFPGDDPYGQGEYDSWGHNEPTMESQWSAPPSGSRRDRDREG